MSFHNDKFTENVIIKRKEAKKREKAKLVNYRVYNIAAATTQRCISMIQ